MGSPTDEVKGLANEAVGGVKRGVGKAVHRPNALWWRRRASSDQRQLACWRDNTCAHPSCLFADEPGLLSGHVLHALVADALRRAVGDADAGGGEDGHIQNL